MQILRKSRVLLLIVLTAAVVFALLGFSADAATVPSIYINGEKIETDVDPYIVNDRVLVPVATIVNDLGGTSSYDGSTGKVTLTYGDTVITLIIGSAEAYVNGEAVTLDVATRISQVADGSGGRTMVPLRFVGETFGFEVTWDGETCSVYIDSGTNSSTVTDTTTITSVKLLSNQKYGDSYYTYVTINADKSLKSALDKTEWLENPCRYYMDFNNTTFDSSISSSQTQDVSTSYVTGVRTGSPRDNVARIVIDMTAVEEPNISYSDDGTEVTFAFAETKTDSTTSSQTWTAGENDTTTVQGTRKYDTLSAYHPWSDGKIVVCIDPGHGSTTGGKRSPDESLLEWEFNRSVAYKLKAILEQNGIQCVMTVAYDDTTDPSLQSRVEVANSNDDVDLFVSIHANAYTSSWNSANGWEVYSYKTGGVSEYAAQCVEAATMAAQSVIRDRGTKTANFYVIKNTEMPAILIEHGFYTNATEVEYLKSDSFRNTLAQADATGIINFFNSFK
ncbi:MAG: N-acetylmuramoyl-L-alanine amidase [Anaerovoracaceae bacterium]|jgi:N-acetylmuramoyl-L-alanine amidase